MSYALEIRNPRSWLFALVVAAAAALRLHALDRFSYWFDEIVHTFWLNGDSAFFWRSIRFDAMHPPLDYLLGRALEMAHPTDWTRKLLPVLWGVLAVAGFSRLITRRVGFRAGILAAVLLAFAPFHVRYSQELLPYSLGICFLVAALLALDRFLERPGVARLLLLFMACLGALYTLYLAAFVLAVAAFGMLLEDAFSPVEARRSAARRFLLFSPLFAAGLFVAYLPWWPVVLEAARRPGPIPAAPVSFDRAARTLSFFAFAEQEGVAARPRDLVYLALCALGLFVALRRPGARFLAFWAVAGLAAIEALYQIHPYWDEARRYLPAAVALPALAALTLAAAARSRKGGVVLAFGLAAILFFDGASLRDYFRHGRQDWRPLGAFLRARPAGEQIFAENQWSQICTAYYVVGREWLFDGGRHGRPISNLDGEIARLTYSWPPGKLAWLVIEGNPQRQELRAWARQFEEIPFPTADAARLYRLDPSRRDESLAGR
ncbi:MAG TPA: glycosyltransferase family 39 protein [Thermoanaerobaculia bacterium]